MGGGRAAPNEESGKHPLSKPAMTESLLGFAVLLALIFLRVPIAFAMALVGGIGFALLRDPFAAFSMIGQTAFDKGLSYSLSVVPLFILMGNLITLAGVSDDLYRAAYAVLGRFRGGLAMASVTACGGFSAVCGSSLATAATMSKVAMPSMRQFGYADSLATGSIAAGGTLGILIPPSVIMVVYGLLTEADIGKLFIAGILPGLLGILFYALAVAVATWLRPESGPAGERLGLRETLSALKGILEVTILFLVIMGGIYGGLFTPTEAAGIGAAASLVIVLAHRRLTWAGLSRALLESVRTTAMIFAVIIGAEIFTNFVNLAGLPDAIAEFIADLDADTLLVLLAIVVIYLLLGCVLESLSMILLTVPVFYPLMYELEFASALLQDPELAIIWFGIVVLVVTEISLITPPIGLNVFVLRAVVQDVDLKTIFKGVTPFWIADILRLALLMAVPGISLWLVAAMG